MDGAGDVQTVGTLVSQWPVTDTMAVGLRESEGRVSRVPHCKHSGCRCRHPSSAKTQQLVAGVISGLPCQHALPQHMQVLHVCWEAARVWLMGVPCKAWRLLHLSTHSPTCHEVIEQIRTRRHSLGWQQVAHALEELGNACDVFAKTTRFSDPGSWLHSTPAQRHCAHAKHICMVAHLPRSSSCTPT